MKFGKKPALLSKKNLTATLYTMKNILKAGIKFYNGKIKTFAINKTPKKGSQCFCLSVILIDSVYKKSKVYYSQVFLEECKYVVKEKKEVQIYY